MCLFKGQPVSNDEDEGQYEEEHKNEKCNDVFWAILFYITVITNIVFASFVDLGKKEQSQALGPEYQPNPIAVIIGILCAIIYTLLWLWIIAKFASIIIKVNYIYSSFYIQITKQIKTKI